MRTGDPVGVQEMEEEDNKSERDGKRGREYDVCKAVEWLSCYFRQTSLACNIVSYCILTSVIKCLLSITTTALCLFSHKVPSNLAFECTGPN